ncbi:LysR family transcriptional regulator [Bosea sp. (in: a-proteobacteria)]|jgi:LysR family nitrogen assimilation transcriptional regulator|uniref:LysR family transcriptional regulator n=1 Tax=Bosea sp. (in: a-proteobacteria) TaxID=1871050 RepID=UPI003F6E89E3
MAMLQSLRDMALFIAAYEERSFTAAAQREHATQSGVSQHMKKLEESLGVRLFERGATQVSPTPAGDVYYRHCIDLLRRNAAATLAIRALAPGLDGEINIGLMPTVTRCVLAPALERFVDAHPNVVVRVDEAYSAVLTQKTQAGMLDFAVVPASAGPVGLSSRYLLTTREVLVSGARRGLPHLAPLRLRDLGPLKVVVPGPANIRRRSLETYFASNGVTVERLLELDAMMGTLDFVANGDWVAVLPGIMMANDAVRDRFAINPLVDPPLSLDLAVIEPARKALSPAADAFLGVLTQEAARLNQAFTDPVPQPGPKPGS